MAGNIRQLNNIFNSNIMIADELSFLRDDVRKGLKKVEKATAALKNKDEVNNSPGAWRDVPRQTEADRYPLVRSDVETMMKKLDII